MASTTPNTDDIGRMYDETAALSQIFIDGQEHLPYWYDDHDDTPVVEAARRITRKVGAAIGLRPGEHVLDAGCGVGAPAVQLAEEHGVRVTGITVSSVQAAEARRRAERSAAATRIAFAHGDYNHLDYPDDTFDAVIAVESLMHADDLAAPLAEFRRVLRPGGRLAIADCTREAPAGSERAARFTAAFQVGQLLSVPEWISRLRTSGFDVEEYTQCGPRVYGMGLRYLDRANELHDELASRFGEEMVGELKRSYRDYFAYGADIGYAIIAARRPYL
ncbi:methyltransferase domain-containing protein [Micromonospora sp. NPDC052213]|uniref:SAM-dependent methyltransferase n=1 Tax=Micromonospora sp. NPDC052213 TaxID=3155812 RepID=UPI00342FDA33